MSNAKTKEIFEIKKKLVSNDSEMSNSARNGKKKFGGSGVTAAVFFQS